MLRKLKFQNLNVIWRKPILVFHPDKTLEIDELKSFLFKGSKSKQSTLDEIYIKIAEIEKDRKMEEANIMFEIHKFDKKIKDMEFNYKATREENNVLRERIKTNENNIVSY